MKLHFSLGQSNLSGYVNVDVSRHQLDLANLDNICEASECTEIIVNDILKFMSYDKMPEVIQHLTSRLRHGSKITIIITDVNSIIREYSAGKVDEKELNKLLFDQGARSCFSYDYLVRILKSVHLNVLNIDIQREQVVITAERP